MKFVKSARLDTYNRFRIPRKLYDKLGLHDGAEIRMIEEDQFIVITKIKPTCIFCSNIGSWKNYKDKYICNQCLKELGQIRGDKRRKGIIQPRY